MKRFCLFLLLIGLSLINTGCSEQPAFKQALPTGPLPSASLRGERRIEASRQVRFLMGTPVEISVVAKDKQSADQAIDSAFAEIKRIEQLASGYDLESALSCLNQRAGEGFVETDKELVYLIAESIRLSKLSRGAFDITVAPLVEAYGFKRREGDFTFPSKEEIAQGLSLVGSDKIIIDAKNSRVKFSLPGMKIDLGGIAKGYAVDRAVKVLKQKGVNQALVNLGGNIFALGRPRGRGWQVGIQHPQVKDRIWATIELDNKAVATSGNYERFFDFQGKRYGHIINPITGRPVETVLSATVIARSALEADGLSTAVFVLGEKKGMELIESIEGVEGVIMAEDKNFPRQIKQIVSKGLQGKLILKEKKYLRLW